MKAKLIVTLLFSLLFSMQLAAKETPLVLDKIVVVVNDDLITQSEINLLMQVTKAQMARENIALPQDAILKKEMVAQLIDKKLQLQLAKQLNIDVSEAEVTTAITNIAAANHVSVRDIYNRLATEGVKVNDYRHELREQMLIHKLQQQEIIRSLTVTPDEIKVALQQGAGHNNHTTASVNSEKMYHVQDILIAADARNQAAMAKAQQLAIHILAELNHGKAITTILQNKQYQPHVTFNDLGFLASRDIPAAFAKDVVRLKVHTTSAPIDAANGIHLVHLANLKSLAPESNSVTSPRAAFSEEAAREAVLKNKFSVALKKWLLKLHQQAYIVNELS